MKFNIVPNLFFVLILSLSGFGQITIDNTTYSTTQLVDGVLVPTGSGTVISNVTYQGVYNNGGDYQVGYFSTAGTTQAEMGFTEGVVLTTGHTSDIPLTLGTNPGSVAQMSTGYFSSVPGEIRQSQDYILDLDILAGPENYFNASILEFDFVPSQSFVEFRYVFGSEEYSDDGGFINYQCTAYNDKFGFLISGPGISGGQGYTNDAENIARLANGSEVGINSVNDGIVGSSATPNGPTFCSSENPGWVQNVSTAEYGGTIDGTQLNGNTVALTASRTGLTPGQTYHMVLVVMDVNDGAYDAVVYLEAGSFTTEAPTCDISDITAGTQTACDPLTNEYTQEVTVTFANPPATGTLDVNGQSFVIGTSPQTVTLTGLTADGNAVDVTAVFSDEPGCTFTVNSLFTAPVDCTPIPCGITDITAGAQTSCDPLTNTYTQEVTITFANPPGTGTLDVNGQSFAIGTSPQTVTLTGLTADGNAVDVTAVFSDDAGCTFTVNGLFTAPVDCTPVPCGITDITTGTQTACDPLTNTYTQEVIVTYANPPATGTLDVNGQSFAIGTSPQMITLTGLTADGNAVDVTAVFSDDAGCTFTVNGLFTAPVDCTPVPCGITDITVGTQTACDPLTNTYTQEVIVTYANPPGTGTLDVNGQSFALGTSPQTVTLTGLTADGNAVDVTAVFSDDAGCTFTVNGLFTAPVDCTPVPCGITDITTGTQTACDPLTNTYTQEVIVTYANPPATGTLDVNGQSFALGTSPQTVTLTGLTADGNAVDVTAVFSDDAGCTFTVNGLFTAPVDCTPVPCAITNITAGTQTSCDPLTNTYTQEVTVAYANPPATGTLDVNGQSFAIGSSPQTVTLTGLTADGNAVDVTAEFSDDVGCTFTVNSLFIAAGECEVECGELYIPTAFSPNGDGNNDEFLFRLNELCVESMELSVYNRWGERIFTSDEMSQKWDGKHNDKLCETGVYVYKLVIKIQGENDSRMETGNINLIR